jgi:hypothetical protein
MRCPFSLFKAKSKAGTIRHPRFWDESLQKHAHSPSTGILAESKNEHCGKAGEEAKALLEAMNREKLSPPRSVSETTASIPAKAGETQEAADMPLARHLAGFWTPGEYVRYKGNVKKKPLSIYILK